MKVLWFSNTPANAAEILNANIVRGGWLKSLDQTLQRKVQLHIAFYYPKKDDPFKYLDTIYYPIRIKYWKLKVILTRVWTEFIEKQHLSHYLEIIDHVKPDIIHIHGTENPFGCIIPYIHVPVVVSIQGNATVYNHKFHSGFTPKYLRGANLLKVNSIKGFFTKTTFMQSKLYFEKMTRRERTNLMHTYFIIGRTAWDRRIISVLAPDSKYFHCDEILRESFYKCRWHKNNRKKLVIHTTTGNGPYKGFETLCEALFELNIIDGIQIEWRVAGISKNDDLVRVTRKKLKDRFPLKGLVLLGKLDEEMLVKKMCEADIYVSPSHIENSPNSLCEAMLIGMPCIATCAGGTSSLIKDDEEGILLQDGDPWSMAGSILELFRNPELAEKYGRNARIKAFKRHDPEKIVKDLLSIYEQIIKSQKFDL